MSFLTITQPDWVSYSVFCKLPEDKQCRSPGRLKFTEEDLEELTNRIADYPVNESVTFKDMWSRRIKGQLVSLEEGVLETWFFGRTVLAGDAIHKVSSEQMFSRE